jgi:aminopeptidase N
MNNIALAISLLFLLAACGPTKNAQKNKETALAGISIAAPERPVYNESRKRIHDLLHTRLDVKFDFEKTHLLGKATLTIKPYFYSSNALTLDAKGMEILEVSLLTKSKAYNPLDYVYEGDELKIKLDRVYTKSDTFKIFINYIAKPNDRLEKGSSAITSDKGLFFINPDGKDPLKPVQVWTQGETESNSVWFPTIDSPNERMSQELYITVPSKFVTLSNGLLEFSMENGDNTRTDYWKQDLTHAPYLTMMAIGEYAIVKDKWRTLDVHYYVEKDYQPYAKEIFGNTPEMMEFYSKILGVDYPWDKYHQVVVRDYVSGAMENTGAVIFGEFMNKTSRELLDEKNESIIAHELFHHWFGDLVTCESWANLPLNESFATYGEYLWIEHKYGRDAADYHLEESLHQYLNESKTKQVDMIRFDYDDKEDMFDSHSYAKGGRILHMLRKYVGEKAFFESLQLYLNTHRFSTVEIHDLRLAFEKVTGEDLNWFFNQWFLSSGHPELLIKTSYDAETQMAVVNIKQMQDLSKTPLYKLPMEVDLYVNDQLTRHSIVMQKQQEEFFLPASARPTLVNVDAEKMLLCEKIEEKSNAEWVYQFSNAPLLMDRMEALKNLVNNDEAEAEDVICKGLADRYSAVRVMAIEGSKKIFKEGDSKLKDMLINLAKNDPESEVRMSAINELSALYKADKAAFGAYKAALNDQSYQVIGSAIAAIYSADEKEAIQLAKPLESEKNQTIINTIASIYAKSKDSEHHDFYLKAFEEISGFNKFSFVENYGKYLSGQSDEIVNLGLPLLKDVTLDSQAWWMRMAGIRALFVVSNSYEEKIYYLRKEKKNIKTGSVEEAVLIQKISTADEQRRKISQIVSLLKERETNENLLALIEYYKL